MIKIKKHHEGAFYILLALGLSRAFNIISLPYLSRRLNPTDFADYTLFITAVSLLTAIVLFGFDASLVRVLSVNSEKTDILKKKIFTLNGSIALSAALLSVISIYFFLGTEYSIEKIILFGCVLFVSAIFPLAQAGLRAENSYKKLFFSLFLGGILTPIISVWMASIGYSGEALIYGYAIGILVSTLIATRFENYHYFDIHQLSDSSFSEALRIGLPTTITAPLFWVITSLDKWVLNLYANKSDLGIYALSATLAAPYMMIVSSLISSFQPHGLHLLSADDEHSRAELQNDLIVLIYVLLIAWIIYTLLVFYFVVRFMPLQYENIIFLTPILSAAYLCNGLFQIENIKHLYNKKIRYAVNAIVAAAITSAIWLFILVPKYGFYGAAIAQLIGFMILFIVAKWLGRNDQKFISINHQLTTMLVVVLIFSAGYYLAIAGNYLGAAAFFIPLAIILINKLGLLYKLSKGLS